VIGEPGIATMQIWGTTFYENAKMMKVNGIEN